MNLKERLEIFKEKGWTYNSITGDIYSHKNKLIKGKANGYVLCRIIKKH